LTGYNNITTLESVQLYYHTLQAALGYVIVVMPLSSGTCSTTNHCTSLTHNKNESRATARVSRCFGHTHDNSIVWRPKRSSSPFKRQLLLLSLLLLLFVCLPNKLSSSRRRPVIRYCSNPYTVHYNPLKTASSRNSFLFEPRYNVETFVCRDHNIKYV